MTTLFKTIVVKSFLILALLFSLTGITASAQYGGTTIVINPNNGTTTTTNPTNTSSNSSNSNSNTACANTSVSSSVAGETVTVNLCKVKAGNTITVNNLNTPSLESLQVTFAQDLDNGIFQIVRIPQSLTYPNLPGNYITAFELLTVNFNRSVVKTITLNYKVGVNSISPDYNYNAYISNSPWSSTSVTKTSQDTNYARFTSTTPVFTQYALTYTGTQANTTSTATSTAYTPSESSGGLIRTGGLSPFISSLLLTLFVILASTIYTSFKRKNIGVALQTKSHLEM